MAHTTTTVVKKDSSDTNITLLEPNLLRRATAVYNNSTSSLYLKYGAVATIDSFTIKLGAGDFLELPCPCYTGQLDGFWETVNGNAMVTEII